MTDKRFFQLDHDGAYYLVVAPSLEFAKSIMESSHCEFSLDSVINLVWSELTPDQVTQKQRCHTEDDRGIIKLTDADIGDWFSSEW